MRKGEKATVHRRCSLPSPSISIDITIGQTRSFAKASNFPLLNLPSNSSLRSSFSTKCEKAAIS